ncbi:MAG: hypothetical protein J6A37_14780 [Oscillospiraceae bacterium]|nr:hypothetical protein [Oscillospiraceae bacterium]
MSNKIKKIAASFMAVAALTTGAMGITASAYSPTITRNFGDGATATLYADSTYAYGTTTCSGVDCAVSVTYHGTTKSGYGYGYANVHNDASGSGSSASSYHAAGGYTTSIVFLIYNATKGAVITNCPFSFNYMRLFLM